MTLAALGGSPVLDKNAYRKWPLITQTDRDAVMRVLDRGVLSGNDAPEASAFQDEFAKFVGAKHALLCHSGTSALEVAVGALGIGEGDEVIMPAYSFVATALSVICQGAIPIFGDVDPETGNIDVSELESLVSSRTKAIMPVHVHGCPADLNEIRAFAEKHRLLVIEDAAQAHGATYEGRPVGTFGAAAGFSLQSSKNLSAGEGGVFVTNDSSVFEKANQLRNFAQNLRTSDKAQYSLERPLDGHRALQSSGIGSMYRGNEMMAAFARSQLARLPNLTAQGQVHAKLISDGIKDCTGFWMDRIPNNRQSVHHKFRLHFDSEKLGLTMGNPELRTALLTALRAEGCEAVLWQSEALPAFPLFQELKGFGQGFPFSKVDQTRLKQNYRPERFVNTKKLLETSVVLFSQTCPLIAQERPVVEKVLSTVRKVWEQRASLPKVQSV